MSNKAQFEHRVASDKEKRRLGLLELAGKIEDRRNCVELDKYDVVNVLRNNAAGDFGTLSAKIKHIKDLCDMVKSSVELNEGVTKWDLDRIDEIKRQAEICDTVTEDLFENLNYNVTAKRQ